MPGTKFLRLSLGSLSSQCLGWYWWFRGQKLVQLHIKHKQVARSSPPGGATSYQLLQSSISRHVANSVTKNEANLDLSPSFRHYNMQVFDKLEEFLEETFHFIPAIEAVMILGESRYVMSDLVEERGKSLNRATTFASARVMVVHCWPYHYNCPTVGHTPP
ncbi:hypothetical protein TNCV_3776761 [Trichonephila clavipes]|nr:hypothetical protein TNCV_3776761 [Trichonephila clavipes]